MDHVRREGAADREGRVKPTPRTESLLAKLDAMPAENMDLKKAVRAKLLAEPPHVDVALDLDDYDDGPHLHLVDPPPPAPNVIVEAVGEGFEVSRLRDNGTTVACVRWTKPELLELIARAQAALKVT